MPNTNAIRIAIGSPDSMQSSIWRFWSTENELYVCTRGAGHLQKLSLHSSGIYRLAYLAEQDIDDPLNQDRDPRVIARWTQPTPFREGWVQSLDILIPAAVTNKRFTLDPQEKIKGKISWLSELPIGYKDQLTLLIADNSLLKPEDILQKDDLIMGSLHLSDGRVAWISARRIPMSENERAYVDKLANDMRINFNAPPDHAFGAVLEINRDVPYPQFTDIALGQSNVYVNGKPYML